MSVIEIQELEKQILDLKKKLAELKRAQPPIPVINYEFDGPDGKIKLSDLFQGKPDLVLVCNMGRSCRHCTLWADGFNGVVPELESRAGFALVSADPIDQLVKFAEKRSWRFQAVSDPDGQFRKDMGFANAAGDPWPGVIGFRKNEDGSIDKIASAELGEGDDFCAAWHLFDLLADGWNGWDPQYRL
jgi:predicted dithiol-disulfide oxidoreductase (DUF899 family)